MSSQNISATIDQNLLKKLDTVAGHTERTRSWLLNKAIETYLEEIEDLEVAKSRLNEKRLSPAEIRKAIGV